MSGAIARQYPDMADMPVAIRLDHFAQLNEAATEVLRQWAGRLSGIKVGVCSHRLYWNPVLNFFHGLARRFLGPEHGIVHWKPEPNLATPLLTPTQFTEEFATALRQGIPGARVQIQGNLQLKITTSDGRESDGFLGNAYNQYLFAPEDKEEVFGKYRAGFLETAKGESAAVDKSRIVPILKDKGWVKEVNNSLKTRGKEKALASIHEPYNDELSIVYAQDTAANIEYLTSEKFASLDLDRGELRKLACANLEVATSRNS